MAVDFGAGIRLDEDFDFAVASSGDLQFVTGSEELEKDLTFKLHQELTGARGSSMTRGELREVQMDAITVLSEDPRVENVVEANVEQTAIDAIELELKLDIIDRDEPIESLVIEI